MSGLSRLQQYLHNGPSGPKCRCLVRWEGFDAAHDSWILRKHVTLESITAHEQILTDETDLGKTTDKVKIATLIGKQGQFSALLQRARQQVQQQHSILQSTPFKQRGPKFFSVLNPLDVHFLFFTS